MDTYKKIWKSILQSWALYVTVFWLAIGAYYIFFGHSSSLLDNPNELGDFLAGFFSPLAFLWLVRGFYQQQDEIRLLQKEVEATNEHMALQNTLLEDNKKTEIERSLPSLKFDSKFCKVDDPYGIQLALTNHGADITEMNIVDAGSNISCKFTGLGSNPTQIYNLKTNQKCFVFFDTTNIADLNDVRCHIVFRTGTGKKYQQVFKTAGEMLLAVTEQKQISEA